MFSIIVVEWKYNCFWDVVWSRIYEKRWKRRKLRTSYFIFWRIHPRASFANKSAPVHLFRKVCVFGSPRTYYQPPHAQVPLGLLYLRFRLFSATDSWGISLTFKSAGSGCIHYLCRPLLFTQAALLHLDLGTNTAARGPELGWDCCLHTVCFIHKVIRRIECCE